MIRQGKYTKKVSLITNIKRQTRRRWRWFARLSKTKKALLISTPIVAFLVLTPLLTYVYYAHDISNQERLMNRNNTGIVLTDRNGKVFYSTGRAQHRAIVPLDQISDTTKHALLASEDKDFYKHGGFSFTSILKALYNNILSRDATGYGGSTLTQQLAKNTLLSKNQTFLRKYQELAVSIAIEQQYSKDQILDMYLNSVYFGENSFGIEDAAKTYFNKAPKDLDLAQSAMLVGVLPAPSAYSPVSGNKTYAKQRQATVLTRMVNNGYITNDQKQAAIDEVLTYAPSQNINNNDAPHFAQMVLQQLYAKYGEEQVTRSGYQVKTTLDLDLQKQMTSSIAQHLPYIQRNGGSNAGAVAIDPTSGEVRGLVGSADWNNPDWGKVNMATTPRQPGSSFKPIYYAQGLAEGVITPATVLADVPTDFNGYKPQNAERTFSGDVTVRTALSHSLNIPSVKVMQKVGIDQAVATAKRMGITTIDSSKNYGLSLALGSAEVPLIEMTNAYAAFANQGQQYSPTIVKQIKDKYNSTIFTAKETPKTVQTPQGSYLISSILSDNQARAPIFGSSLTVPGKMVAVKTGTTDNNRDAWTIGYTPQLAVGVWVGNNNNDPMLNGGSGMAGPIWVNTMKQALAGIPNTPFAVPSGIIQKPVCYAGGGLASAPGYGTYNEYFLASALPSGTCSPQKAPEATPTPPPTPPSPTTTTCPTGQTGTPPNCTSPNAQPCPTGQTGTPPDCTPTAPATCPTGQTGTPPNCTPVKSPPGQPSKPN
ncbi:MAG: PBP1A family penicillin-binding protein [Candidatus Saccharimonadales bacterium]